MKTNFLRVSLAAVTVALIVVMALPSSGWGLDIRIPHPKQVVGEARGAVHRVAREVEGAGRRVVRELDSDRQGSTPRSRTASAAGSSRKSPATKPPATGKPPISEAELVPQGPDVLQPSPSDAAAQETVSANAPVAASNTVTRSGGDRLIASKDLPDNVAPSPETAGTRTQMMGSQAPPSGLNGSVERSKEKIEVPFARPVPGKKGLVYTPGGEETPEAVVDVRDIAPGTLVKNPRTGVLFRVP